MLIAGKTGAAYFGVGDMKVGLGGRGEPLGRRAGLARRVCFTDWHGLCCCNFSIATRPCERINETTCGTIAMLTFE